MYKSRDAGEARDGVLWIVDVRGAVDSVDVDGVAAALHGAACGRAKLEDVCGGGRGCHVAAGSTPIRGGGNPVTQRQRLRLAVLAAGRQRAAAPRQRAAGSQWRSSSTPCWTSASMFGVCRSVYPAGRCQPASALPVRRHQAIGIHK